MEITWSEWWNDSTAQALILNFRLPKAIALLLVGIGLPVSGFLLQELFRNPIADPSVLGISAASGLGVAMVIFLAAILGFGTWMQNPWLLIGSAFLGSFLALLVISLFAAKIKSTSALIIVGFMISGFASALIGLMQFWAPSERIKSYLMWSFGSVSGLNWQQIVVFSICILIGLLICTQLFKSLAGLRLGENYAQSMGINVKRTRWLILISTAILTASSTAFVGPIAFIGLAVPHIVRMIFREMNVVRQFTLIGLSGMVIMLFFGWLTQLFPKGTLPINIITSLVGTPIVISIIWSQFKSKLYE